VDGTNLYDNEVNIAERFAGVRDVLGSLYDLDDAHIIQTLEQVMACYGVKISDDGLAKMDQTEIQAHAQNIGGEYSGDESFFSLAEGNELLYTLIQNKLGISADTTILEKQLDLTLLQHGGYEVANQLYTTFLREESSDDLYGTAYSRSRGGKNPDLGKPPVDRYFGKYEPTDFLVNDKSLSTPFNVSIDGQRHFTQFVRLPSGDIDYDRVEVFLHKSKTQPGTNHLEGVEIVDREELLNSDKYTISLKAIPRVMLYCLSGMSGHITGGGSGYNSVAKEILNIQGLPYFPIWHFAKYEAGRNRQSPLIYTPTPLKQRLHELEEIKLQQKEDPNYGRRRLSPLEKEIQKLRTNVVTGQYSLIDLILSYPDDELRQQVETFTKNPNTISPLSQINFDQTD
jgi:hypothetical protein